MGFKSVAVALACCVSLAVLSAQGAQAQEGVPTVQQASPDLLADGFRNPPQSARPRVWWHWMNGNITREGIARDLEWMQRVGIGGLQNFDVDLSTSQIVGERLAYMSPGWRDAFRFAAEEADRRGLELTIASSPGWSLTGGPWVPVEDALKKVVWSETLVQGGSRLRLQLAQPPATAGPYQDLGKQEDIADLLAGRTPETGPELYRDVRVLAVPAAAAASLPLPVLLDANGQPLAEGAVSADGVVSGVRLSSMVSGEVPELHLDYGAPVTVRSAIIHVPGGAVTLIGPLMEPRLQYGDAQGQWVDIASFPLQDAATTVSFPAVTARRFRIVVSPAGPALAPPGEAHAETQLAMEDRFGAMFGQLLSRPVTIGHLALEAEPRIDRFQAKAGFGIEADYQSMPQVADAIVAPRPDEVLDITQHMTADGSLDWNAPAGSWRILRMGYSLVGKTNHPAPVEATGLEVDKYDGAAVERYLEHYLGNYRQTAGEDLFGTRGVRALLTDSIEIGAANWTPRLVERFRSLRGYDPTPWLPALAGVIIGSREESDRFLFDYRRTLSDLMGTEHYATVAEVADRYGLQVYGEALEGNMASMGDDLSMRRYTDFPMAAMWTYDRASAPSPSYVYDIRGAASVASLYGQNIVAAESMTAGRAPWAFGPADLKHIADMEFILGVNRPVIHTSVHAPVEDRVPGLSLNGIGQFFNRHETWADLAAPWVDYLSRNSYLLQQGHNVADVAYYYGETAPLAAIYRTLPLDDVPAAHAYDFVNAEALFDALRNDGANLASVGGARYRLLYLGGTSRTMSLATLRRLAVLAEGGATIVGIQPTRQPGLGGDEAEYAALVGRLWSGESTTHVGRGQVIASASVDAALSAIGVQPDFTVLAPDMPGDIAYRHREMDGGHVYFLVNRSNHPVTFQGAFRVAGHVPELWDPLTGEISAASFAQADGQTVVPLTLTAGQSLHVVFRGQASQASRVEEPIRFVAAGQIEGPWRVAFQPERGAPATIAMDRLTPLDENSNYGVSHFSGVATYTNAFTPPPGWTKGEPLRISFAEVREVAEVRVNGELAGFSWFAPHSLEIGHLVQQGRLNTIEVRVANLWVNRLIADAGKDPDEAIAWATVPTYLPTATLRRSGLIGPVQLLVRSELAGHRANPR